MFEIDDKMLDELGLNELEGNKREQFKSFLRDTLQERVGEKLTKGMPEQTLDEFGYFMDGNIEGMKKWLSANVPDYANDPNFIQFKQRNPNATEADILASYGSLAWLQTNRPDYPEVVKQALEEIKQEVRDNKQAILNA